MTVATGSHTDSSVALLHGSSALSNPSPPYLAQPCDLLAPLRHPSEGAARERLKRAYSATVTPLRATADGSGDRKAV